MAQTNTDRQAAAKKAAATRQTNQARQSLDDAWRAASAVPNDVGRAARSIGDAAASTGKALVNRARSLVR